MAGTTAPKPVGLKVGGKRLWTETLEAYELRQDELVVLKAACFEVDLIDRMEKELKTETLTVRGSMGQLVPHPLVSELRQHRATLATILRGLKLPDTDASPANQQRSAAQNRWSAHGQAS